MFLKEFRSKIDSFANRPFIVFADMTEFKSPSSEVKELIGQAMKYALNSGLYKAVELMPLATQRMGIDQAAKQVDSKGFRVVVKEKSEAMRVIDEITKEILASSPLR